MDPSYRPQLESPVESYTSFKPYTAFPNLERALERILGPDGKLQLPAEYQRSVVKYLPWVALAFLPLHFFAVVALLGMTAIAAVFGHGSVLPALVSAVAFVLNAMALPGLFKQARNGWALFTYAALIGAVAKLFSLSLVGLLLSVAVVWLLFQVKYRYA